MQTLARRLTAAAMVAGALLLGGCGFQLRGAQTLPFNTLYIEAAPTSTFAVQMRRLVTNSSQTRIMLDAKEAEATLQVQGEAREKEILSLSGGGRVREFQLRYRVSYRVLDAKGVEILPASQLVLRRDFSFNDEAALAKESEEALLFRDMQTDAVLQLLRRLHAVQLAAK
jgi:LPS-assembly lipoprotein